VQEGFRDTRRDNIPCASGFRFVAPLTSDSTAVTITSLQNSTRQVTVLDPNEKFSSWIASLDDRYLSELTPTEAGRALRALSSCYVERRSRLAEGAALATSGKRAAFAVFYGPLHFLVTRDVIRALRPPPISRLIDLGCGTGAAGAAWALESNAAVTGFDRHPWAVREASWTYKTLGVRGRARIADLARVELASTPATAVLAAYAINEISEATRRILLPRLLKAGSEGARVLILEPIARKPAPWWTEWSDAFQKLGGRADEWRFPASLPVRQAQLARAAGLKPRELTARSLYI
jgi:methyltransferase family protein